MVEYYRYSLQFRKSYLIIICPYEILSKVDLGQVISNIEQNHQPSPLTYTSDISQDTTL